MRFGFKIPSPAMVVASIALLVALGGTSYAAVVLPKNSVGATQLKANAVTSAKIKDRTIAANDLTVGTITALRGAAGATGPQGPAGPGGPAGPAGTAVAYGTVEAAVSGGVLARYGWTSVIHQSAGRVLLQRLQRHAEDRGRVDRRHLV